MSKILVLHGPNLQLLGDRETEHYGSTTLMEINQHLAHVAEQLGFQVIAKQSNHEGILIDWISEAKAENVKLIIFNPAGFTHTSIALRDTFLAVKIPLIEVHISNIYQRESFRHHSYFRDIAIGTITGFGALSYTLALHAAMDYLKPHAAH